MIVVTGGAGLIGSALIAGFNERGEKDLWVVDALGTTEKWHNLLGKSIALYSHKDDFLARLHQGKLPQRQIRAIFHMGACSRTTEADTDYLMRNNTLYTRDLAVFAVEHGIPFYYASSAATYGDGSAGFNDDPGGLDQLRPRNAYGFSKHLFDLWARREGWFDRIAGFKFFNVYGPNEYHKTGMTSIVYNAFRQIQDTGTMRLFASDHPDYRDGEQLRDFIYVKDVVRILLWFWQHPRVTGIFNIGAGRAVSWRAMTEWVFQAMDREPRIEYVPLPETLRSKYQYFTEADTRKLEGLCPETITAHDVAIRDYVNHYLAKEAFW